mgnify:FL=1
MGGHFDLQSKNNKIKELETELQDENIWNNVDYANKVNSELVNLKKTVSSFNNLSTKINDSISLLDILSSEDTNELKELETELNNIKNEINDLEIETLLNGPYDNSSCYLEIHPGAGGTEACDWADMLLRMYTMFCDKNNYKYEIIDKLKGDTAGIKSVTLKITGDHAYGYFKSEIGVHRLVRISPFNAAGKRQTSFASVSVIPEINKDIEIDINPNDIRVDVYRSSGCGGQGVNTTDSAVRITHIPTNIVVTCQNERSQIQNKETAMNLLRSKLFQIELKNKQKEINDLKGETLNIDFGSQIRNYTLEPYSLVKDVRTNYETTNTSKVLDGDILEFMKEYLRIKR